MELIKTVTELTGVEANLASRFTDLTDANDWQILGKKGTDLISLGLTGTPLRSANTFN